MNSKKQDSNSLDASQAMINEEISKSSSGLLLRVCRPTRTVALFCSTISIKRVIRREFDDDCCRDVDSSFGGGFLARPTLLDERALTANRFSCRQERAFVTSFLLLLLADCSDDDGSDRPQCLTLILLLQTASFRLCITVRALLLLPLCGSVWPDTGSIANKATRSTANICHVHVRLDMLPIIPTGSQLRSKQKKDADYAQPRKTSKGFTSEGSDENKPEQLPSSSACCRLELCRFSRRAKIQKD